MIPVCEVQEQRKLMYVIEIRIVVALEEGGLTGRRHKGTFQGDENNLYCDWGMGYISVYTFIETHLAVPIRPVHFTVYKLYFN